MKASLVNSSSLPNTLDNYVVFQCASIIQLLLNLMLCVLWQVFDSPEELKAKVETLAQLIKESQYLVVHSGAGISTSAGIPDFR